MTANEERKRSTRDSANEGRSSGRPIAADYRGAVLAILFAAAASIVAGAVWYAVLGTATIQARGPESTATAAATPPLAALLAEFVRSLVIASVIARFIVLLDVVDRLSAVRLGIWLWVGFPAMLLLGSVLWEGVPWLLATIHAGDWLVKLLLMTFILGAWRRRVAAAKAPDRRDAR
jgi:hypothetical protein